MKARRTTKMSSPTVSSLPMPPIGQRSHPHHHLLPSTCHSSHIPTCFSLKALSRDELIQCLYSVKPITPPPHPPSVHGEVTSRGPPPTKLECMTEDEIITAIHHPNSCLSPVWPCDTPNSSDTKTTYTPEELHRLTGCRQFRNYQHIISMTKDGSLLNTGKFPLSLGTYATIPKAPRGKAIDKHQAKYLNIVHINIAFGDCVSVGGFKFALIFVNRATCYKLDVRPQIAPTLQCLHSVSGLPQ
jgi:hypothetical protein